MATRIPVIRLESNDEPRIRFEEDQWLMSPLNKHDRHADGRAKVRKPPANRRRRAATTRRRRPREPRSRRARQAANRAVGAAPDPAAGARLPGPLQNLAETARDYAKASSSDNTRKAYGSDWRHFSGWARRHGLPALPPDPQILGLYVAACASGAIDAENPSGRHPGAADSALHGISRSAAKHSTAPTASRHRARRRPPHPGAAARAERSDPARRPQGDDRDARSRDLRGLRDRAILLIGFAGGLRRSKSSGSTAAPGRPRTEPAGPKSSTRASWSRCAARPGGARSRSAGAPASSAAPSSRSRPG